MSEEELKNLTVKEICNYIAVMNRLVNEGIIKFNKEKAYTEICVDEATIYLEKQNVQLKQENTKLKSVLKEIREHIIENVFVGTSNNISKRKLLDIIDKGIGEEK